MYWWYIDYISIKLSLRNRENKITHTGFWAASPLSTSVEALLFQSLHPPSLDFLHSPQRQGFLRGCFASQSKSTSPAAVLGDGNLETLAQGVLIYLCLRGSLALSVKEEWRDFCLGRAPRSSTQVWIHCLIWSPFPSLQNEASESPRYELWLFHESMNLAHLQKVRRMSLARKQMKVPSS